MPWWIVLCVWSCLLVVAVGVAPPGMVLRPPVPPLALPAGRSPTQMTKTDVETVAAPVANIASHAKPASGLRGQLTIVPTRASWKEKEGGLMEAFRNTLPTDLTTSDSQLVQQSSQTPHPQLLNSLGAFVFAAVAGVVAGGLWWRRLAHATKSDAIGTEMRLQDSTSWPKRPKFAVAAAAAVPAETQPSLQKKLAMMRDVDPKLKLLYQTQEYEDVVELLKKLNDEKELEGVLKSAQEYWRRADLQDFSGKPGSAEARQLTAALKRDWPAIWPAGSDSDRMRAWDVLANFYKRLDASRVWDLIIDDLQPEPEWAESVSKMTDDERDVYFTETRFPNSKVLKQIAALTKDDGDEIKLVGLKLKPFMTSFIGDLTEKQVGQVDTLPWQAVGAFSSLTALGFAIIWWAFLGFPNLNPLAESEPEIARTAPTVQKLDMGLAFREVEKEKGEEPSAVPPSGTPQDSLAAEGMAAPPDNYQ